jgi:hypothetical protein
MDPLVARWLAWVFYCQEKIIDRSIIEAASMFVMAVFVLVQFGTGTAPLYGLEREQRYATIRDCEMDGRVYGRENEQRYRDYAERQGKSSEA